MKKSLFLTFFMGIALLAGSVPVITNAQAYYGSYGTYGATSCLTLTAYQQLGSTDAQTGGQVSILQTFLNQTGYLSGVSGTFDEGTLGAVINFQNAHGIIPTGTVGPQTQAAINAQSCSNGYNTPAYQYPITNYSNGSNCYWSGGYNSTYICRTSGTPIVYPVPSPIVCNNYGYYNGYYNSGNYYNNGYNNCYGGVQLNSLSASYGYNTTTITISGYGFSTSGNTVNFGNSIITNVYSSNGTTLTFTVPSGYSVGTYGITVTNAQGRTSNSLQFVMSGTGYWGNNNYYNNYNNCGTSYWSNNYNYNNGNCYSYSAPTLSSISGPSNVQANTLNTWNISVTNAYSQNVTLSADWGDGSTSIPNNQQSYNTYNNNYSFTHQYRTPGVYTLRVTATSNNGRTSYQTYLITVSNNYYYGW